MKLNEQLVFSVCKKLGIEAVEGTGKQYLLIDGVRRELSENDLCKILGLNSISYPPKITMIVLDANDFNSDDFYDLNFAS